MQADFSDFSFLVVFSFWGWFPEPKIYIFWPNFAIRKVKFKDSRYPERLNLRSVTLMYQALTDYALLEKIGIVEILVKISMKTIYRNDSEDSTKKGPKSGGRVAIGVTVFYLCRVICVIFSTNCYLFATISKVGQNCFEPDNEAFIAWLDSLSTNVLYKSMLEAHTATKL